MIEDKFYRCIPELNKECKKNNCYINGGECEMTICKQYSLKGLLEENERLNNIIGEAIEYIEERYNGEVLTHTFDKDNVGELLNILKGVDKE